MFRLNAYGLRDGRRLCGLRFANASWSQTWNGAGSLTVDIPLDDDTASLDLDTILVEQQTALALLDGDAIIHAGPIMESPSWDAQSRTLSVSCGGGWSLLEWRLVLDPLLRDRSIDGEILIDEDNPGGEWEVAYQGTAGDIANALTRMTKRWADLPIDEMPASGGTGGTMQWEGWEFTTISDALADAVDREDGGQLRFDPFITVDGRLRWRIRWAADGITDRTEPYRWNTTIPGQRVRFTGCGSGGGAWVNEVWATDGKSDDVLRMYRLRDEDAVSATGTLIQQGESNTGTGDSMAALHSYVRGLLGASRRDRTWDLQVGYELHPHVGDRVRLRVNDPFLHAWRSDGTRTSTVVSLIITDISGDAGGDWLKVSCRETGETVNGVRSAVSDPMMRLAERIRDTERKAGDAGKATRSQTYQTIRKVEQLRAARNGG